MFGTIPCFALGAQITLPTQELELKKKTKGEGGICAPRAKHGIVPNIYFQALDYKRQILLIFSTN